MQSIDRVTIENNWHVTHFGSNANNGANAGTFYWNLNNDSSNRNRNIGTQLAVVLGKVQHKTPAAMCGEYVNPITLGSYGEQRGGQQR